MARNLKAEKIRRIFERQRPEHWLSDYEPSIRAVKGEAPPRSRAVMFRAAKVANRHVHCLSAGEEKAAVLGLYHDQVFNVHEQKMLAVTQSQHPLANRQGITVPPLPSTHGSLAIAHRLNVGHSHPMFRDQSSGLIPVPLIGDFLWFLRDEKGPYCAYWNVKHSDDDHQRAHYSKTGKSIRAKEDTRAIERLQIEEAYYAELEIPHRRVVSSSFGATPIANLLEAFRWHRHPQPHPRALKILMPLFEKAVLNGSQPNDIVAYAIRAGLCSAHEAKTAFYQGVWTRRLRPDLNRSIILNDSLVPESADLLCTYRHLFARP